MLTLRVQEVQEVGILPYLLMSLKADTQIPEVTASQSRCPTLSKQGPASPVIM